MIAFFDARGRLLLLLLNKWINIFWIYNRRSLKIKKIVTREKRAPSDTCVSSIARGNVRRTPHGLKNPAGFYHHGWLTWLHAERLSNRTAVYTGREMCFPLTIDEALFTLANDVVCCISIEEKRNAYSYLKLVQFLGSIWLLFKISGGNDSLRYHNHFLLISKF